MHCNDTNRNTILLTKQWQDSVSQSMFKPCLYMSQTLHVCHIIYIYIAEPLAPPQLIGIYIYMAVPWSVWVLKHGRLRDACSLHAMSPHVTPSSSENSSQPPLDDHLATARPCDTGAPRNRGIAGSCAEVGAGTQRVRPEDSET